MLAVMTATEPMTQREEDPVERKPAPFWKRHPVFTFVLGFAILLVIIGILQYIDEGDVEAWLGEQSEAVAYVLVFLLVFGDAIIPIFPGETTLAAASTLAADGELQLQLVMVAGALGAIAGDSCLFWIARKSSTRVKPQLDKLMKNRKIKAAWEIMDRSAPLLIVAGRFVPGMRFAVNVTMGLSDIRYRRFLVWSIVGGTIWSIYTCGLAYLVATSLSGYPLASIVISALVTSAAIGVIFFIVRRRQRAAEPEPVVDGS